MRTSNSSTFGRKFAPGSDFTTARADGQAYSCVPESEARCQKSPTGSLTLAAQKVRDCRVPTVMETNFLSGCLEQNHQQNDDEQESSESDIHFLFLPPALRYASVVPFPNTLIFRRCTAQDLPGQGS